MKLASPANVALFRPMCKYHRRHVHVRTKSTKASHKKHHTIQLASRSCDGVNASRSTIWQTLRAALSPPANVTHTPPVIATAWVEAPIKHRPGARSHQLVRHRRPRRLQRQHVGGKAFTSNIATPANVASCRSMWQHHRRQVRARSQSTKQATKSTTPFSQHHALVTVSMHRNLASPRAALCAAGQHDLQTIRPCHCTGQIARQT